MASEEAAFIEWLTPDGQAVSEGDLIYTIETEKVTVEIESGADGVLRHGEVTADEVYAVGTEIGYIEGKV
jgi:pyruvate/2-oxoglutarate dehydrogenase complex dihydrolipoamide acyltransferase (E2) component